MYDCYVSFGIITIFLGMAQCFCQDLGKCLFPSARDASLAAKYRVSEIQARADPLKTRITAPIL